MPNVSRYQPQGRAQAASNAFARGLVSLATPGVSSDAITRRQFKYPNAAVSKIGGPQGIAWQGSSNYGGVDIGATGGVGSLLDQTKGFSWYGRVFIGPPGTRQFIIADYDSSGNIECFSLTYNGAGSIRLETYTGSSYPTVDPGFVISQGWHDLEIEITASPGYTQSLYVDGALVGSTTAPSGQSLNPGSTFRLLCGGAFTGNPFLGQILVSALWSRNRSATERAALRANPWQLFATGSASPSYQSAIATQGSATGTDGNVTVTGVSGTASAGNITSNGGASASVIGTQASGQSGTISASFSTSATATVSGVAATGQSGSISAAGNATTAPSGVSASSQSGSVSASAGTAGTATVSGVASSAQSGSATALGNASTLPVGQMASAQTGTVVAVAGGNANVAVTGIAALVQAGTIIAKGNGLAMLAGMNANGMTGQPSGSGSSQTLLYGAVAYGQSGQASAIGGNGNASVSILGAGAAALVGQVSAAFIPSSIGINITEDMLCKAVRSYILSIRPTQRIIRTPVNLASMPNGPYVSFTPGRRMPLSTNVGGYLSGSRSVGRAEQMGFQIDCYGDGARDLADTINILFRDQYAIDQLAQSGLDIAPLYAGDVMQMPFVDDADQYEERYSFEIFLQINSVVITPQQSCNMLGINILSVDATYPPV